MGWFSKKKPKEDDDRIAYVFSTNGLLRVGAPSASGWQRMEATARPPMVAAIKCIKGTPPHALALDALLYELGDEVPSVETLRERDWRAHFQAKMFAHIDSCDVTDVKHTNPAGFTDDGCQVRVRGALREPDMEIVLRERHVVSKGRLLVVSAAGSPDEHAAHKKVVDAWLEHATIGG